MAARYPLAGARTQREQQQDAAARQVAEARACRDRAQADLAAANEALAVVMHERAALLSRSRPSDGGAIHRGLDLARSGAYSARLSSELSALARKVQSAESVLQTREHAVRAAESALAHAYAQRELIERHHARFRASERRALEHAQELEAEDLLQSGVRSR